MAREVTVILKQPEAALPSPGKRAFDLVNTLVKSPLFVFIFGASFATIYPAIKSALTPAGELQRQKAQEDARADATLIAPFLANLSATEPGKFQASRAALQALQRASQSGGSDKERPMFVAVNEAVDAVAKQIWPPTEKNVLTQAVVENIDKNATVAPKVADAPAASFSQLQNALVYIQVDRNDRAQQALAERIMKVLRTNSVVAPGIEKLPASTMPSKTQVRYFHESDRPRAESLAAIVSREIEGKQVYLAQPKLSAKEGTLELWFGKD
jgi:hypothetical protein